MSKAKYQLEYSKARPQMCDTTSREEKAKRIIILLHKHFGIKKIKNLEVLDVGASTGIIDNYLVPYFKSVVGIDIDKNAIKMAKEKFSNVKNLSFINADCLNLPFKDQSFDIILCTHVYEHVPNPKKLFLEIYRVLKKGGCCYLAAGNSLWPIEPHYKLPFLSYLPKSFANKYIRIFKKANMYYETLLNYWQLKNMLNKFNIVPFTSRILTHPKEYGYNIIPLPKLLVNILHFFVPTFFWLLIKEK